MQRPRRSELCLRMGCAKENGGPIVARTTTRTSPVPLFRPHRAHVAPSPIAFRPQQSSRHFRRVSRLNSSLTLAMSLLVAGSRRLILSRCAHSCSRNNAVSRYYSQAAESPAPEECDVVIVGGGPAGLALSSALGMNPRFETFVCVLILMICQLHLRH